LKKKRGEKKKGGGNLGLAVSVNPGWGREEEKWEYWMIGRSNPRNYLFPFHSRGERGKRGEKRRDRM